MPFVSLSRDGTLAVRSRGGGVGQCLQYDSKPNGVNYWDGGKILGGRTKKVVAEGVIIW